MSTLKHLWRHRERPASLKRLVVVWAKRALQAPALWRIARRERWLRAHGAEIGDLVFLGQARIEGRLDGLVIESEAALGRCEIALHDRVVIGRRAVINDGVALLTGTHSLRDPSWQLKTAPIRIGAYAWIAQNAMVLPGVSIGIGAVVGAGSIVREDVPAFALAIGNPAKIELERRSRVLEYSPAGFTAPFEAWLGRQQMQLATPTGTSVSSPHSLPQAE